MQLIVIIFYIIWQGDEYNDQHDKGQRGHGHAGHASGVHVRRPVPGPRGSAALGRRVHLLHAPTRE